MQHNTVGNIEDNNINSNKKRKYKSYSESRRGQEHISGSKSALISGVNASGMAKSEFSGLTVGFLPLEYRVRKSTFSPAGRGRRPLSELKMSRHLLAKAHKEVASRTKTVLTAPLALKLVKGNIADSTSGSKTAVKFKAALIKATRLLNSAQNLEVQASPRPAKVIVSEAAKVTADIHARTIALYIEKQEKKTEADLQKAAAKFISGWQQKRSKTDIKKLAKVIKKVATIAAIASCKANAKVKTAVLTVAVVAEARARKAAAKVSAIAAKLEALTQAKTQLAV